MTNAEDTAFTMPSSPNQEPAYGLTKREYLAAMAMQGLLQDAPLYGMNPKPEIQKIARMSVTMADALIDELNNMP